MYFSLIPPQYRRIAPAVRLYAPRAPSTAGHAVSFVPDTCSLADPPGARPEAVPSAWRPIPAASSVPASSCKVAHTDHSNPPLDNGRSTGLTVYEVLTVIGSLTPANFYRSMPPPRGPPDLPRYLLCPNIGAKNHLYQDHVAWIHAGDSVQGEIEDDPRLRMLRQRRIDEPI